MVFIIYEEVIVSSSGHVFGGRRLRKVRRRIYVEAQGFRHGGGCKQKGPELQSPLGTSTTCRQFHEAKYRFKGIH